MKMDKAKTEALDPILVSISEPERSRLANLDEEILLLGKELEDLKTQTIDDFHSDNDDDVDPFNDEDDE